MTMALLLTTFMDIGKTSIRNILDLIFLSIPKHCHLSYKAIFCLPVRQELLSIKIFSIDPSIIIFYKIQNLAKSENLADSYK